MRIICHEFVNGQSICSNLSCISIILQVYIGADLKKNLARAKPGEAQTGYEVVMDLLDGLHGRGHVAVTDNFFTSPKLFVDLLESGTYGRDTLRANRIGLPSALIDKRTWAKAAQGAMDWTCELCALV